jgi:hypothetical protein
MDFMVSIMLGRASKGLVCPCCCIRSATANSGGGQYLLVLVYSRPSPEFLLLGLADLAIWGETAMVIEKLW